MIDGLAILVGAGLVLVAFADLVNTLVSTSTSTSYQRWWPSRWISRPLFVSVRAVASRLPETSRVREASLAPSGPSS